VGTTIKLGPSSGGDNGYRGDFRLERDLLPPITIDATELGSCHPMFVVRLRLFIDWHLALGHDVSVVAPTNVSVAQHLADMQIAGDLPDGIFDGLPDAVREKNALLGLHRLVTYHDVEDAAATAAEVLGRRIPALGAWGDAAHMAISELCDNAIQHGKSEMGAYVAVDRVVDPQPAFRLAIADLGIGIPEHIRAQHPEWQDDDAAISRVLVRGVTGTGDPMRGNGYAEVLDQALGTQLRRSMSALTLDIRSAKGHVGVRVVDEVVLVDPLPTTRPRRGTWITYEVVSVE
jgi:anti-sigma regulatory factor (Ser/Thr protein kinase)